MYETVTCDSPERKSVRFKAAFKNVTIPPCWDQVSVVFVRRENFSDGLLLL